MKPSSLPPIIRKNDEGGFYLSSSSELDDLYHFILGQAKRLVSAKSAAFYFRNERGNLSRFGLVGDKASAGLVAKHVFKTRKSILIKKGSHLKDSDGPVAESYIACYVGDEIGDLALGVLVLEGIKHFQNFSEQDLDLINYFSANLNALLKDTVLSEAEPQFFNSLTTSILLLIDNANIHNNNNRLQYFLEEIIRVAVLINTSVDLERVLVMVMESAKSVFRTEASSLLLLDDKKEYLIFHTVTGEKREEVAKIKVPVGQGIAGTVAVTKQPMIINDAQNDNRVFRDVDKASNFITRNILASPLIVGDEVIGVIEAINTIDRNNFSQDDIDTFLSFSSACAVAIQKTRLLENLNETNLELKQKLSTLESIFDLGQAVLESHDELGLMSKTLSILTKELSCEDAGMVIIEEKNKNRIQVYARQLGIVRESFFPMQESRLFLSLMESGNPRMAVVSPQLEDSFLELEAYTLRKNFLILPIAPRGGSLRAALYVSGKQSAHSFNETDLRMLKTLSSPLAKAYENLKLNQEIITKKSIEKEIEITRKIQNNILPNSLIQSPLFDLGVMSVAAKEVSGDFYDFHSFGEDQFSFLVADVSGKSLPAAIFMAMSSSIIRTLSRTTDLSPSELLFRANQLIYEDSQSGMFVTLFLVNYQRRTRTLKFASAGHNDQIWIRKDGSFELLKGKGAPLGVVPHTNYQGGEIQIEPGDILVFYTDGAIEEKNPDEEEYGLDRFIEFIIERRLDSSQKIVEAVYDDIRKFSRSEEQYDDFTVMILKFAEVTSFEISKVFPAHPDAIPELREFISEHLEGKFTKPFAFDDVLISLDEAATNIVMHSYKDTELSHPSFECRLELIGDNLKVVLIDEGKPFDRKKVPKPSVEANLKGERKGGFGVYLMETLMDKVSYDFNGKQNITYLEKTIV
ncbi:SpoIIE family protein phosphatase [Leptospira sp. 201903074]|uniref:SpoIIE family protein phosphatase n=1 Tax=Leptospira abararensis TaxID=2810036 RepID=UPI00196396FF|nr:SpoIIE family protein phosphatase [Leptospira abararensis]MBM9545745.1 SpoIIE family protein phosphatase [Leptospira abararensis]